MVEFKKDIRDGEYKLMEINPKFWGSLDLSIACGVNFPKLLVEMALNGDIEPVFNYSKNIFYRWPFPDDLLHLSANPYRYFKLCKNISIKIQKAIYTPMIFYQTFTRSTYPVLISLKG
jgi:predicted ATP-grasp superfamily ATP-dependent carboligase